VAVPVALLRELKPAETTLVWLLALVHPQVILHVAQLLERGVAESADKRLVKPTCLLIRLVHSPESIVPPMLVHHLVEPFP